VDGALVRVAIVCARARNEANSAALFLNGQPAININADLTFGLDLTRAVRLKENANVAFQGVKITGPFDVSGRLAREWLFAPLNPNGRPNSDVLKRLLDIDDITGRSTDRWVIDFDELADKTQAVLYELPFEHIEEHVKPFRFDPQKTRSDEPRLRELYWLFQRPRPKLRHALLNLRQFIIIPETREHRIVAWGDTRDLIQGSLFAIARDDFTTFGVLNSRFHDIWATRQGNRLGVGNQRRYNITRTFETYPFPENLTPDIPAKQFEDSPRAKAIAAAAKRLDELRAKWLNPADLVAIEPEVVPGFPNRVLPKNTQAAELLRERTLTNLYNHSPQWLVDAHHNLDVAVASAYGWQVNISDDGALAALLELNGSRGTEAVGETSGSD
jgi:type II restriction/modification system DNA methylase subunit YeeA